MNMGKANLDQTVIPETLQLPFSVLLKFGVFSKDRLKKSFLMSIIILCLGTSTIITMVQLANIQNDVSEFVRNLEPIIAFTQVIAKVFLATYRVGDILKLIETTKLFWNSNKCNQQTATKLWAIYHFIYRLQRAYQLLIIMSAVGVITVPLLGNGLPLGIWTLDGYYELYYFAIIQQVVSITWSAIFILGLELMYLGFCVEIIVQFKLLCSYIEELTAEGDSFDKMEVDYLSKIKTCIRHHQLMLWFIKKFRQTFSSILLAQHLTICPLVCAELFVAFEGRDFEIRLRHFIIFLALAFRLSIYCIPADYLADEATAVANAVYFSKWYVYNFPSLKKPLLIMMQNSQKEIIIKAGGLVPINTETFVNVLKVAWSACSVVRGLKQN